MTTVLLKKIFHLLNKATQHTANTVCPDHLGTCAINAGQPARDSSSQTACHVAWLHATSRDLFNSFPHNFLIKYTLSIFSLNARHHSDR